MQAKTQLRKRENGFTLLEIMVVLVILGLLAAVVAPNVLGTQDKGMVKKVHADLALLEQAIDMYKVDNFSFPTTDEGLEALVNKPAGKTLKNYTEGGYIKRLPADPWGNPYQYLSPGKHGKYDVFSLGADGQLGGEGQAQDIGNW